MAKKQTAGRDQLGDFAPKFAELNDDVLFGQVWSREKELSPRDRSFLTVTALITKGAFAQLPYHMQTAKKRDHEGRNCGNDHPISFLRWLAKCLVCFRCCQEGLG